MTFIIRLMEEACQVKCQLQVIFKVPTCFPAHLSLTLVMIKYSGWQQQFPFLLVSVFLCHVTHL